MKQPALELQEVTYTYEQGKEAVAVVRGISLRVAPGEWIAIIGASGSGKSTLTQLMSGYLPRAGGGVREGSVRVGGIDPAEADIADVAKVIGVVFQDPDAQLVQGRVEDETAFGPENLCVPAADIERRVTESLAAVGLSDRRMDAVHDLSGGGRQRTAIASVLSMEPPILVFDEAAASLDPGAKQRQLTLLRELHRQGRTIVTVSGRLDAIAAAAPRLVVLAAGRVLLDGPTGTLLREQRPQLERLGLLPAAASGSAASAVACASAPHLIAPAGALAIPAAGGVPATASVTVSSTRASAASGSTDDPRQPTPLLEIRGLSYAYVKKAKPALRDISLKLLPGEWRLLCGENGSGKTTLSRLIMGLLRPPKGKIFWQGRDTSGKARYDLAADIGYVFQQPEQQFVASSVLDELLYSYRKELRIPVSDDVPDHIYKKALSMLDAIRLTECKNMSPYMLSGGAKKLLSVASVLIMPKRLYILDEPTAGADYEGGRRLAELCGQAIASGASIIMITHEPEMFEREATSRWTLDGGRLVD